MNWQWIWTAIWLDWHKIGNAFVPEWLWIDIELPMDWNRIGIRLVMDWHLINIGFAIDRYKIVNGLVLKLCVMGGLMGLDWNRIDPKLHWVGTEFTPLGFCLATPLALVWQWNDIRLNQDWHWIYINLTRMWWRLAQDWLSINTGLSKDWHRIGTWFRQD